jgi:hypothetical protein
MADNTYANADTGLLPRTFFKAPRVPLDLRALFLALLGYVVFRVGGWVLNEIFAPVNVVKSFFAEALSILQLPYVQGELDLFVRRVFTGDGGTADGTFWHDVVGGVWTLSVWGFFGQAIHRITSLRIARDEGLSLKAALGFSVKNFPTIAYAPLIVFAAIGIFYGCNALAGLLLSIPWIGGLLGIVLLPLAVISTLLILLIAIGGAVGLPLVGAAAAWERNGSLDAISRAFSYVFARPLQFFWNYFLVLLFTSVILIAGAHFESILTKSVDAGLLAQQPSMMIDTPRRGTEAYDKLDSDTKTKYAEIAEKTDNVRPFAVSIHAVGKADWGHKLTILTFWGLLNLIRFGVLATAIWWFFGATTSIYADLRADVDGTEEDEIYLEEEQEDFDALAKSTAPATPAPPAPPAAPSAPPPGDLALPPAAPPPSPPTPPAQA